MRRGIASLLAPRWEVCGEARDGLEAVAKVMELKPDVVILDLSMPVMGGTAAARQIRSLAPSTKIIFLSMHDSETVVELTRLAGADACVSKRCSAAELHKAVSAVLRLSKIRLEAAAQIAPGERRVSPIVFARRLSRGRWKVSR